ncbi:MAG: Lrp/AsnC family transcriptional regulator [Thermoplasmata archaeon]|nr:MAG: Lrp/AsnC family transcriptional regulator [Thermoplasmata archaeon]
MYITPYIFHGGEKVIKAYILIRTYVGKLENVLIEMKKLNNIESVAVVTGDYDIIVKARVDVLEDLMELTDKIQLIDGIKRTTTSVIEKEITL